MKTAGSLLGLCTMCSLTVNRRFTGAFCLHHQGALSQKAVILKSLHFYGFNPRPSFSTSFKLGIIVEDRDVKSVVGTVALPEFPDSGFICQFLSLVSALVFLGKGGRSHREVSEGVGITELASGSGRGGSCRQVLEPSGDS